jgi:ribosome-binding factor A
MKRSELKKIIQEEISKILAEAGITRDNVDRVTVYYVDMSPNADFDHVEFTIGGKKVTIDDYSEAAKQFSELMSANRIFGTRLPAQYNKSQFDKFAKKFTAATDIDNIQASEFFW